MRRKTLVPAVFLLAAGAFAVARPPHRQTQREGFVRKGPGAYYEVVDRVKPGVTVETGDTRRRWVACRMGNTSGWLPTTVFERPRSGLDYSGFIEETDVTVVSSVDIAAATKGAFSSSYAERHNVSFAYADRLQSLTIDSALVEELRTGLHDRESEHVLRRMPPLRLENNIIIRPDAEKLLGRGILARIVENGYVDNGELTAYVNAVAAVVAGKAERYDLSYKVGITEDSSINGFGLPGGYIILTRGLVESMRDESELACALGHEMAHISRYHGLREFKKREVHRRRDRVFAELETVSGGGSTGEVEQDLNKLADTAYLTIIGGRAREDEFEADLFGVAYAAAAGYCPRGMVTLLERIGREHNTEKDDVFRHHPPVQERVRALQEGLRKYRLQWDGQKQMASRYDRFVDPQS